MTWMSRSPLISIFPRPPQLLLQNPQLALSLDRQVTPLSSPMDFLSLLTPLLVLLLSLQSPRTNRIELPEKTVYLMRHGISRHNHHNIDITSPVYLDASLDTQGAHQALAVGTRYRNSVADAFVNMTEGSMKPIELVCVSPLTRCLETAHHAWWYGCPLPPQETGAIAEEDEATRRKKKKVSVEGGGKGGGGLRTGGKEAVNLSQPVATTHTLPNPLDSNSMPSATS